MKDYRQITRDISENLRTLRRDIPETMQGFSKLAQASTETAALDKKTKELIALAIGVVTRCDGASAFTPRLWSSWAPAGPKLRRRWE
jgi:alkylhydroperoxidase/carboxymuconolactone decarboxylase family protein YurZ